LRERSPVPQLVRPGLLPACVERFPPFRRTVDPVSADCHSFFNKWIRYLGLSIKPLKAFLFSLVARATNPSPPASSVPFFSSQRIRKCFLLSLSHLLFSPLFLQRPPLAPRAPTFSFLPPPFERSRLFPPLVGLFFSVSFWH